ncbi:cyclic nucleotide-gated cation channel beta-3-like isoform X2 [Oncorhynchus keta]|uniref:cyclic nucleotide-gated cation channel beta-3-like isoform X2 n=1 Tax=Oncorhynchus keta TaxID=8018 RepID=UPI0015FE25D1|nr:cyclic nucleotide-gated cation channel beta-3-like isoform X2 [Oncorhynchus keta]
MFGKLKRMFIPQPPTAPVSASAAASAPAPVSAPAPASASAAAPAPAPAPIPAPATAPAPAPAMQEHKPADKENGAKKEDKPAEPAHNPAPASATSPASAAAPAAAPAATPAPATAPASAAAPAAAPAPAATPANPGQEEAEGEEVPPPPPPPIVVNRYSDDQLRVIVKRMRERTEIYREKLIDPHASSPEFSPPVTPIYRKKDYEILMKERLIKEEQDRIKKEGEDLQKKEAAEKKKQEMAEKKAAEQKAKDEAKASEPVVKPTVGQEVAAFLDRRLKPIEDAMDSVLPSTIDPFSDRTYIAWLTLVTLAFNYNTWFMTARLCFPYHTPEWIPYWITMDLVADFIYLIDSIFFQARKQFVKGGDVVKDRIMTKAYYRNSERFKMDMIAMAPIDLLCFHFGYKSIFRFNRMIKVDTFFEFSDRLESLMSKAYIWRVVRTIGYLLFMLHLNACAYYVASAYQGIGKTTWVYTGKGSAYLSSFFYAEKSLLMIAELPFPDTLFGQLFQMANYFFGAFFLSIFLGQMRDVIGAATTGQTYFRSSMDNTVYYMVSNNIPKLCQNRIRTWYNYTWDAQGMLDESELLEQMPLVMRTAIAVDINLATFQKIDLFKGCDNQMLVDMLLRLKSIIYLPGDFVVQKGDIGKEMYIIKSGAVQVVGGPDNSIVFVTLKAGCVFGEISLLQSSKDGGNRRTANVKAHGFANLSVLEKKDLFEILVHYPMAQKVLARKGKKLMKAKGPAAAKAVEDKKKGLALFGPKPPTPKMLRVLGGSKGFLEKLKQATQNHKD